MSLFRESKRSHFTAHQELYNVNTTSHLSGNLQLIPGIVKAYSAVTQPSVMDRASPDNQYTAEFGVRIRNASSLEVDKQSNSQIKTTLDTLVESNGNLKTFSTLFKQASSLESLQQSTWLGMRLRYHITEPKVQTFFQTTFAIAPWNQSLFGSHLVAVQSTDGRIRGSFNGVARQNAGEDEPSLAGSNAMVTIPVGDSASFSVGLHVNDQNHLYSFYTAENQFKSLDATDGLKLATGDARSNNRQMVATMFGQKQNLLGVQGLAGRVTLNAPSWKGGASCDYRVAGLATVSLTGETNLSNLNNRHSSNKLGLRISYGGSHL